MLRRVDNVVERAHEEELSDIRLTWASQKTRAVRTEVCGLRAVFLFLTSGGIGTNRVVYEGCSAPS